MKKSLFAFVFALLLTASCALAAYVPGVTKKLVVGTSCTYAPYEFVDENGKPTGFDIELMEAVAAKMGVEIEWFDTGRFDALLAAVPVGKVDCAIAGMVATEERAKKMLFSDVYKPSHSAFLTKSSIAPKTVEELKGLIGAVQQGTIQETALQPLAESVGFTLKAFPKFDDCVLDIATGRSDFSMMDIPVAKKYMELPAFKGKVHIAFAKDITHTGPAIATQLGNTVLINDINKALAAVKADGTVAALIEKWKISY